MARPPAPDPPRDPAVALAEVQERVVSCRRCPRLVAWRQEVAREKRAAFRDETYWGRRVTECRDRAARLLIVGLAPAAHGANRTGRMFTGDRSGEWLFRALHRAGFANQPTFQRADDGLRLHDAWLTASVRCAPPGNRPTPQERDACRPYLEEELGVLLPRLRVVVALGSFGWSQFLRVAEALGAGVSRPRPAFGHLAEASLSFAPDPTGTPLGPPSGTLRLLGSFHPSQQNTFTGRLTQEAFDAVWTRAREVLGVPGPDR